MGSDAPRALLFGGATLSMALAWLALQTLRIPTRHPSRLVAELRLAQAAAVLLAFSAALIAGLAAAHPERLGAGLDMAFAVVWCGLALMTLVRDATAALAWLAGAFLGRAALDLLHVPGWLPGAIPVSHLIASAIVNLMAGAWCAAPLVQRRHS